MPSVLLSPPEFGASPTLPDWKGVATYGQDIAFLSEAVPLEAASYDCLDEGTQALASALVALWWLSGAGDAVEAGIATSVNIGVRFAQTEVPLGVPTDGGVHPLIYCAMVLALPRLPKVDGAPEDYGLCATYALWAGYYMVRMGPGSSNVLMTNALHNR